MKIAAFGSFKGSGERKVWARRKMVKVLEENLRQRLTRRPTFSRLAEQINLERGKSWCSGGTTPSKCPTGPNEEHAENPKSAGEELIQAVVAFERWGQKQNPRTRRTRA